MLSPMCRTCRDRRVKCDGAQPGRTPYRAIGVECLGYGSATAAAWESDDEESDRDEDGEEQGGELMRLSPDPVPVQRDDGTSSSSSGGHGSAHIPYDPIPPQYTEAQMIYDGIHYYNERVSGDLISIASHFNPYQVSLNRIDKIPDIYVRLLVTCATLHRAMQHDTSSSRSSALVQRERVTHEFRIRALQQVNHDLSKTETQTSDATLMCVICLLLSTVSEPSWSPASRTTGIDESTQMQQSAYTDWRVHLEGARKIIKLRGGLKGILSRNPYFKPLLALFVGIDVIAATTTPTTHRYMAEATSMACRYWEVEPGFFQVNLAISAPCPEELFQTLILINYLRSISLKPSLSDRRQAGTRMVLNKIRSFNPTEWATRMKMFKGWKSSGDGVEFVDDARSPSRHSHTPTPLPTPSHAPRRAANVSSASSSSSRSNSDAKLNSPTDIPEADLWLNISIIYQAAILLYAIRTLILDMPQDRNGLLSENPRLNITRLRQHTRQTLADAVAPVFSDPSSAHQIGKLIFFPVFVLGMEVGHNEKELQEFVTDGLALLGHTCGTLGPIAAIDEVRGKWAADAAAPEGTHVTWDEYFQGRPDFIFGF
ncbi:fungal-specific transcription factor domain-containing protein [Pseudomassariella vexata]|uniref:Fungal-specific transcription factor domain-domain-containing protein n=1 Tax=Pseudomassariella vexata TaxID=1141098 RepID=A0A1Y2EHL5_9PEZI|nr:fungal-specific transcription factor domain-containing protein [Pseudomassariella vexata]ORY71058.1 fungal-specific transcription factor domain-domain-containing protein [Pseudomassariella vexata]